MQAIHANKGVSPGIKKQSSEVAAQQFKPQSENLSVDLKLSGRLSWHAVIAATSI